MDLPEVYAELHDPADRELVANCGVAINPNCREVHVKPFQRFGYSGSQLYLAHFANGETGLPFVVKVAALDDIREERDATVAAQAFFADAHVSAYAEDVAASRGALASKLVRVEESGTKVRELLDLVKTDPGDETATDGLVRTLERTYGSCCAAAHGGERQTLDLSTEYERDLKRKTFAETRLAALLGATVPDTPIDFLGAEIHDPRFVLSKLDGTSIGGVRARAIHGDLHSSNILLRKLDEPHQYEPHLVDFARSATGAHVLRDFVLLECSLRFLVFPDAVSFEDLLLVDTALLEESGPDQIPSIVASNLHVDEFTRLGRLLATVRAEARRCSGPDYEFQEYLTAQFVVLYGLLRYDTYRLHRSTRALGLIGQRLLEA